MTSRIISYSYHVACALDPRWYDLLLQELDSLVQAQADQYASDEDV